MKDAEVKRWLYDRMIEVIECLIMSHESNLTLLDVDANL